MRKGYLTTIICILLGLGFLAAAAGRIGRINQLRTDLHLENVNPITDSEITSEFRIPTVALFTFRSLVIDYLWIRADNLKNEGQYFDALHLARLICDLQPNLASVWDFQSWNMAYNISVALPNGPERWNWVKNGYELLRDQGLKYNPRSPELHRSLAWIFQHKIGGITDDMHRYYKERLAYEMMRLMGSGRTTNRQLLALAQALRSWPQISQDLAVAKLVDAIRQAEPQFTSPDKMFEGLLDVELQPLHFSPELHQVLADNAQTAAFEKMQLFIRYDRLKNQWKLDPNEMLEINRRYGPVNFDNEKERDSLDWRLPFSHAIYWAMQGLKYTDNQKNMTELNLQRVVYHSLQDSFHQGNLQVFSMVPPPEASQREQGQEVLGAAPDTQIRVFLSQDLRMFPVAYQATVDLLNSYAAEGQSIPGGVESGSINIIQDGIVDLYLTGHVKMARTYYEHLRRRKPDNPLYRGPLEQFVKGRMVEEIESIGPRNATNYIKGMLAESFARSALRDDENAAIREKHAQTIHQYYLQEFDEVGGNRVAMPPFTQMKWLAMLDFFNDPAYPADVKGLLLQRLKTDAPQTYDRVWAELQKQRKPDDGTVPGS